MKTVILDGYTINPGDLSWDGLAETGKYKVYDRTAPKDVIKRASGADAVLTSKVLMTADVIAALPELKYIGVLATGYNNVDLDYAGSRGITVTNIPAYSTESVAQLVFAMILAFTNRVEHHSDLVLRGKWAKARDFSFRASPLIELAGKTVGIVGMGNIGNRVADIAGSFGMRVLGNSRTKTDQSHRPYFQWADFNELLRLSDFVSLNCPLTGDNVGFINYNSVSLMKKTAFLINAARGGLVDEAGLARALNEGVIAGAALDVLPQEPPQKDNVLYRAKNVLITPHIGWATYEARARLVDIAVGNVKAFAQGAPVNTVV